MMSELKCSRCTGVCHHCGQGPEADGDHSCPCPHRDEECKEHPLWLCAFHMIGFVFAGEGPYGRGTEAAWGVQPDPEIEERFRRDMEEIRESERKAWRDAATVWLGAKP